MQLAHILLDFHVFFLLQNTEIKFSAVCFFDKIESRGQVLRIKLSKVGLFCFDSSSSLTPKSIFGSRDISGLQIRSLCDLHFGVKNPLCIY